MPLTPPVLGTGVTGVIRLELLETVTTRAGTLHPKFVELRWRQGDTAGGGSLSTRLCKTKNLGWQNELATDPAFRRFRLEVPMARTSIRARPDREEVLWPVQKACPACGTPMRLRYDNGRTLVTRAGPVRLRLKIRRCERHDCARHHRPYRPEAEGAMALPGHEFGLDVIVWVGRLRHREHRSVPEIHKRLREQGVAIAERSVTNLLDRYDELLATSLSDSARLRQRLAAQGRVILALDGLQPDVGHEVLWVIRDCLSGEVLLARSLLSGTAGDLAPLLREVASAVGVPVAGVISAGQTAIRRAVAQALPGVPHQLCQFHFLREAARPIFEAMPRRC